MATKTRKIITRNNGTNLMDLLSDKSLKALSKFGHVYCDPYSGRNRIRVYNKPNKQNVINNSTTRRVN